MWLDQCGTNPNRDIQNGTFNGDYTYMQLLKYFILKSLPDGEIKSDFMSYIENEGQEDELSDNWLTEMR